MATGYLPLPIAAGAPPDGTAGNVFAPVQRKQSSAASPAPAWFEALMDASTVEALHWAFQMPGNYSSAPVIRITYKMASATSGNIIMEAHLAAVSDGDATDTDAKAFAAVNTSATTAVPGTAGYIDQLTISLTNADSVAANDWVVLRIARDADNASDTATGDLELIGVSLEYTTT